MVTIAPEDQLLDLPPFALSPHEASQRFGLHGPCSTVEDADHA